MKRRAVSPAASENEVDILGSLFTDDHPVEKQESGGAKDVFAFDAEGILDAEDGDEDEAFIALKQAAAFKKASNLKGKTVKKGGGFQAMGLSAKLLQAIHRKGFDVPTPIQRKAIPLILDRKDVVGMARTGSGKTAAFVLPMIERLRAHSATYGSRALILSPSRELAIQTLKVVKDFSRGTDLKCVLLVGGDSLEEQFRFMTANPDIVIATPGRFLHLKVEMSLDLSSIQYVVFDEADRLFEEGFGPQLSEILHALPSSSQRLLFSATLPATLVEFAKAGLQDPKLVRLDAETKVSPDLKSAYFSVKGAEKEGTLLHVLHDVIKIPLGMPEGVEPESDKPSKKRKRGPEAPRGKESPTEHSTIIFAATKHRVEHLVSLLQHAGFAVAYVYGSLDQMARTEQVSRFRRGHCNILVVTDVAARGIDLPMLANVVNYDFPPRPKVWVHRVGRTARAGQRGWSYSLVQDTDVPYLIDLQLFLGRKLVVGQEGATASYTEDMIVGAPVRSKVEAHAEWVNKVLSENSDIKELAKVAGRAEKRDIQLRPSASAQSARRSREVIASKSWMQLHPIFNDETDDMENARAEMLARISGYRPPETIFEIKSLNAKGARSDAAEVMRNLRQKITPRNQVKQDEDVDKPESAMEESDGEGFDDEDELEAAGQDVEMDEDSDSDLEVTISSNNKGSDKTATSWQDPEIFMSYTPRTLNAAEERGYGVNSGNFVSAAREVTMDLKGDDGGKAFGLPSKPKMRWDQKSRRYVGLEEGTTKGGKMIRGESGVKIAASFQSGRFDRWKKAQRLGKMPRVGDLEKNVGSNMGGLPTGKRFKHNMEKAPKEADKFRDDYHVRKKRVAEAREKRIGRFKDGAGSKKEIKGATDIRKARQLKEKRKAKNARPSRK